MTKEVKQFFYYHKLELSTLTASIDKFYLHFISSQLFVQATGQTWSNTLQCI